MAYAPDNRALYDADSHIMELPDFLKKFADPDLREELPEVQLSGLHRHRRGGGGDRRPGGRHSPEHGLNWSHWATS